VTTTNLRYRVTLAESGATFDCRPEERVLIAMERRGLSLIPVGCRGGGCGACRVRVLVGAYETGPMSRRHVSPEDAAGGCALACRLYPKEDLSLTLAPSPHCAWRPMKPF